MKKAKPFLPNDYYERTKDYTPIERACYIDLLFYLSNIGNSENDIENFRKENRGYSEYQITQVLEKYFTFINNKWVADDKIDKTNEITEVRAKAVKIGHLLRRVKFEFPFATYNEFSKAFETLTTDEKYDIVLRSNGKADEAVKLFNKSEKKKLKKVITTTKNNNNDEEENNKKDEIVPVEPVEETKPTTLKVVPPLWKTDFEEYKAELRIAYKEIMVDDEWIGMQQKFHPGVNIKKTIEKACVNFWSTEAGWKNKKRARIMKIDWRATMANAISQKINKVYETTFQTNNTRNSIGNQDHSAEKL